MVPRAESVTWKPIPAYIRVDFYDHAVNDDKVEILFSFESYPCEFETWSKEGMQWRKLIMNDHWMDRDFFKIYWSILERNTCSTGRRYVRAYMFLALDVNHSQGHPSSWHRWKKSVLRDQDDPSGNKRSSFVPQGASISTNKRSVTSTTLKTHFNHDRRKHRRDRDPSIARPGRVYVFAGVVTLC